MNVSVPYKHNSGLLKEALTDKNNFTEHKSSLSPQYEYVMRFTSKKDRENMEAILSLILMLLLIFLMFL